jgi:SAM-dependent methyltransferase
VSDDSPVQRFTQELTAYQRPPLLKDSFRLLYQRIEALAASSVLDIGCANGDFLHFLPEHVSGTGIDVSAALVEQARDRNRAKPNLRFAVADALDPEALRSYAPGSFDVITIIGTLHSFLDFRPLLDATLRLRPRHVLVNSPFNDAPVDTHHYHRLSGSTEDYQSGYSLYSLSTVGAYLTRAGVRSYVFTPSEMTDDLPQDPQAPLRNYHVRLQNGERFLTNGIGILFREYILEIALR